MKISARNQITGKIKSINKGAVNGIVDIDYGDGEIISTISLAAIKDLDLNLGDQVTAVIKATDVMIGKGELKISARNQLRVK
jgi:molybdate transport system regulatory protein